MGHNNRLSVIIDTLVITAKHGKDKHDAEERRQVLNDVNQTFVFLRFFYGSDVAVRRDLTGVHGRVQSVT